MLRAKLILAAATLFASLAHASDVVEVAKDEVVVTCKVANVTYCVFDNLPSYGKQDASRDSTRSPYVEVSHGGREMSAYIARAGSLHQVGAGTFPEFLRQWRLKHPDAHAVLKVHYKEWVEMLNPKARVTRLTYVKDHLFIHFVRG